MHERAASRAYLIACCVLSAALGCDDEVAPKPRAQSVAAPAAAPAPSPAQTAHIDAATSWLAERVRGPAGDPRSAWALAHGLLAFGPEFRTRDDRGAVDVAAAFAERLASERGGVLLRFPVERAGVPVEPHTGHTLATFVELGLPPTRKLKASDGSSYTLAQLEADLRAQATAPVTDLEWHDYAFRLEVMLRSQTSSPIERQLLTSAALTRLEHDDAVIADPPRADAFAPDQPMGAAKRGKLAIYGHPCGGLHFIQAILHGVGADAAPPLRERMAEQLRLLLLRADAERALYTSAGRGSAEVQGIVAGQELKFFGHLLETLVLAQQQQVAKGNDALGKRLAVARVQVVEDVLRAIDTLKALGAYDALHALQTKDPQRYLDLVGDGCHALHALALVRAQAR